MSYKSYQTTMSTWRWRLGHKAKDKHLHTSSRKLVVVTNTCSITSWTMGTDRQPLYKTQVLADFNNICFRFKSHNAKNRNIKQKI